LRFGGPLILRIAYLILCHKHPEQVRYLVERLNSDGISFVIHVDGRSRQMLAQLKGMLSRFENVRFAKQFRCYWGRFGIVEGTVSCMRKALETPFDYAMLLSGQDYPVTSNAAIKKFLSEHKGKEFIESFSILQPNRWNQEAEQRAFGFVIGFRSRIFRTKWKRKFPLGYVPYGGGQWWCLSREAIEYIVRFVSDNPSFYRYFRFVFAPDELIFQSVLSNSTLARRICWKITYDDWSLPAPPYPKILDESDFEILNNSNWLFARKLDHQRSAKLRALLDVAADKQHD
jgi:hypothetical protein